MSRSNDVDQSTFWVFGELIPPDTAFFDAQEQPAGRNHGRVEVFGHRIAYWEAGRPERYVGDGVYEAIGLLELVVAAYAVLGGRSYELNAPTYLESKGVYGNRNVLGTLEQRFQNTKLRAKRHPENVVMRDAVKIADQLIKVGSPFARLAVRDLATAQRDRSPDAFMYAYRAVEGIRQSVTPGDASSARWQRMHDVLATKQADVALLTRVSKFVRHGDVENLTVSVDERRTMLEAARRIVRLELRRLMERDLRTIDGMRET